MNNNRRMKTAPASWADLSSFHKIIVIIIYWTYNCHKYIHKGDAGAWNELPPSAPKPTALIAAINPWTRPFPLLAGYLKLASSIYCESALRSLVFKKITRQLLTEWYSWSWLPWCSETSLIEISSSTFLATLNGKRLLYLPMYSDSRFCGGTTF